MRTRVVLAALAAAVTLGCASSGGSTSGGSRPSHVSRDVIAEAEITGRAPDATNALQIIEKLRPQMLASRGLASPNDNTGESTRPKVYVDNIFFGDLSTLRDVVAGQVKEIRFINARDATTQWGTGHMGGVILVVTRKR